MKPYSASNSASTSRSTHQRYPTDHGLTLDVIRSNHPDIRPGFKVHQR